MRILRLTAIFAGIAAVLTAAGVGRLAAHASVEKHGGRRQAMRVARRAHAAASAGLIIIATVAHGLPDRGLLWLVMLATGALVGMGCGQVIGFVCGGAAQVKIGDVMAAAIKRPSEALRQLLDPEDLIKLGAAVRQRTTNLFEGIFEPAERPPTEGQDPAPPADPPAPSEPK
jgi:hypothetical protein